MNNVLSYSTNRDLSDYSSDDSVITLLLDSPITDDNLSISYSGTSLVDASSANSSAGIQLDNFTDQVVVNTSIDNPLLTSANIALDGKTLTLDFSKTLDSSDVVTSSTFVVEVSSDNGSTWQQIEYTVDSDSTDFVILTLQLYSTLTILFVILIRFILAIQIVTLHRFPPPQRTRTWILY